MPDFVLLGREGFAALDSSVKVPRHTVGAKAAYPTIIDKAAVLWCALIKNHPFVDGNKRVGTTVLLVFLLYNGYVPLITDDELVEKALAIASTPGLPWKHVSQWLREHTVSLGLAEDKRRQILRERYADPVHMAAASRLVRRLRNIFVHGSY